MKQRFDDAVNRMIDAEVENLDPSIQARLDQARYEAVRSMTTEHSTQSRKPILFSSLSIPFGIASMAAVLMLFIMIGQNGETQKTVSEDDFELLSSDDTFELLQEDLAFYAWLEEQNI